MQRRGWQQLPDADAGFGAAEDLRRSQESANRRIDLSGLRERLRSGLDGHGPTDNGRLRSARLLLQSRVPEPGMGSPVVQLRQRHGAYQPDDRAAWERHV